MSNELQIYGSPRMFVAHGEVVTRTEFIEAILDEIEDLQELLREMKAGAYSEEEK